MAKAAVEAFGTIDILVNNAAIEFNESGNLIEMPFEQLDKIVRVNLYGPINCVRSVVPMMMERRSGKIVNVSSIQGLGTHLPGTSYQVSKAGLIGLTHALAVELAPHGINVNAVTPGAISTEGMGYLGPEHGEIVKAYRERIPLGRRGTPEEVAGPILYLCSDAARYVTGTVHIVDGGYIADITPDRLKPKKPEVKEDPDKI